MSEPLIVCFGRHRCAPTWLTEIPRDACADLDLRVGYWRCPFSAAHVEHFKHLYGDLLLALGYETGPGWQP